MVVDDKLDETSASSVFKSAARVPRALLNLDGPSADVDAEPALAPGGDGGGGCDPEALDCRSERNLVTSAEREPDVPEASELKAWMSLAMDDDELLVVVEVLLADPSVDEGDGPWWCASGGSALLDDDADCRSDRNADTSLARVEPDVADEALLEASDARVCRSVASLDSGSVELAELALLVEADASPPTLANPLMTCTWNAASELEIPLLSTVEAGLAVVAPDFFAKLRPGPQRLADATGTAHSADWSC